MTSAYEECGSHELCRIDTDAQSYARRTVDAVLLKYEKCNGMGSCQDGFCYFTYTCDKPLIAWSNGEVDMAWMMVQASPIFLTDVYLGCCFVSIRCI